MKRILIHHHVRTFIEGDNIWLQSFIGSWISELKEKFALVGLIVAVDETKDVSHDYCLPLDGISIHDYYISKTSSRLTRRKKIASICKEVSGEYDILLIRGVTPFQKAVHDNTVIKSKIFFLVGSIIDSRPIFGLRKNQIIRWVYYWVRLRELNQIAQESRVISNSKTVVKELDHHLGIESLFVPTSSISKASFTPLQLKDETWAPSKLLFCGRVTQDKGVEDLFNALSELIKEGYELQLEVVGSCDDSYRHELISLLEELKLLKYVSFRGFVPFGPGLLEFYKQADIYILPSWHEGFPHSIWEAASCCTPVVTTPVGGIPGMVSDLEVCFAPARDPITLASAIKSCLVNSDLVNSRVSNLYNKAMSYTSERCSEMLYEVITTYDEES